MIIKAQRINGLWTVLLAVNGRAVLGFGTTFKTALEAPRRRVVRKIHG